MLQVDDSIFESVKLSTEINGTVNPAQVKSSAVAIKRAKT